MTVNSEWIEEKDLLRFFQSYEDLILEMKPTYFELATAIGFWYFREEKVDIAIIETGLGGRLDATNIIYPVVSVITSVGMDHTDILGDTIEEISREKAGIIKRKIPVVTGNLSVAALAEVERIANQLDAPLIKSSEISCEAYLEKQPLVAKINGRIVEAVVKSLSGKLPVSPQNLTEGFKKWMGRFPTGSSFRRIHSDYRWYFDGAHNTDALKLLKQQMKEIAPLSSWSFVFAIMRDKLTSDVVSELSEIGTVYYHPLKLKRAATENEVRDLLPNAITLRADNSLPNTWVQKNKSELVIFGGSFYFYKTLMQWINNIVDC
jgi:dihydrofolate synthase/folylpolyglutamate synthase